MAKKYEVPEEESQMVREGAYAYKDETVFADHEEEWYTMTAPCQYTAEELNAVILQSLEDEKDGRIHSHVDVQRMINSRIEAWR